MVVCTLCQAHHVTHPHWQGPGPGRPGRLQSRFSARSENSPARILEKDKRDAGFGSGRKKVPTYTLPGGG